MNRCANCESFISTNECIFCGHRNLEHNAENFPPVVWGEVRDNLVEKLMIDPEWMVEADNQLSWWPWFLRQDIYVSGLQEVEYQGREDVIIKVTAATKLGQSLNDDAVLSKLEEVNANFPFGSYFLEDGEVKVECSIAFGALTRSLFGYFHDLALVQTTYAHEIAQELSASGFLIIADSSHPESGTRLNPDELLLFYGAEEFEILDDVPVEVGRQTCRDQIKKKVLELGATIGFENEDVTFFNFENGDLGIGVRDYEPYSLKTGPGLVFQANIATLQSPMSLENLNAANMAITDNPYNLLSHFCSVNQVEGDGFFVVRLQAYVNLRVLALDAPIDHSVVTCINVVHHFRAAAHALRVLVNGE